MIVLKQICVQKKTTSMKVQQLEYKFITSFIVIGIGISILWDVHFQILSTQNRQNA